jgi:PAS domain S-box-containing protein
MVDPRPERPEAQTPGFVPPPPPRDEFERLGRIAQLGIRPGQRHEALDVLMQAVGTALNVPIALVSIVDSDEQFFLARHGLEAERTSRAESFCGHCVLSHNTLNVPDSKLDPRFFANPLVLGGPEVRSYLGIPIFGGLGQSAIGTVCAIDRVPRTWTAEQETQLARLAQVVEHHIEGLAYRRAWQHSPLSLVIVDRHGRCIRVNPAFERFVGVPVGAILERPITSFLQPRDRNVIAAMIAHALKHRESPTRRELAFLRLSGELVAGGTSVSPLVEPEDQVVCVIRDISLERRIIARSGVVHEIRRELDQPLGEAHGQLKRLRGLAEAHEPEARLLVDAVEERLRELDGLLDARIGDIGARAQIETELRASEQRLQALVNRVLGAMFVIDDRGRIVDANPTALESYGWTYDALIGNPLTCVLPTFTAVDCERWFSNTRERAELGLLADSSNFEHFAFERRDGSLVTVELDFLAMDWNGPGRLVLIARDISVAVARESALQRERDDLAHEVKRSTTALREVQRMESLMKQSLEEKDTLLKEIHHRVKNNLQMVSSLLSLQMEQMPEGRAQDLLAESVTRVRSMALIHQHLYGSVSLERVDLANYAKNLAESLRHVLAPEARVEVDADHVEVSVEEAVPTGLILNELLTNALKYGRGAAGHVVRTKIREVKREITLEVRDNGSGLPDHFQMRSAGTLGLQLVTTLSRQLRGRVRAYNDGGAVFELVYRV